MLRKSMARKQCFPCSACSGWAYSWSLLMVSPSVSHPEVSLGNNKSGCLLTFWCHNWSMRCLRSALILSFRHHRFNAVLGYVDRYPCKTGQLASIFIELKYNAPKHIYGKTRPKERTLSRSILRAYTHCVRRTVLSALFIYGRRHHASLSSQALGWLHSAFKQTDIAPEATRPARIFWGSRDQPLLIRETIRSRPGEAEIFSLRAKVLDQKSYLGLAPRWAQ